VSLRESLSSCWSRIQRDLFPWLEERVGPLTAPHQDLVKVLEMARIEALVPHCHGSAGRPPAERAALARAFVAKAVFNVATTRLLIERVTTDNTLRRLCGWEWVREIPSEATFSRAFAEFAASALPSRVHEALIAQTQRDRLVGHISRDSTTIEAREKPVKVAAPDKPKYKPGRPRQGEKRPEKLGRRLEAQPSMSLEAMLADLPRHCAVGTKRNAKGHQESWTGYKLHLDVADGGIPISCLLTAASLNDSQAAIPLASMTAARVTNLYDLMDSAYDAPEIREHSRSLGHVPIIDINPRATRGLEEELKAEKKRRRCVGHRLAEERRYNERTTVERVNARIKDEFGGRTVRVRGHTKVICHLMFGIVALTVDQLMRFVT
jgi:DDE family transposase/transposase-like protein DUF772